MAEVQKTDQMAELKGLILDMAGGVSNLEEILEEEKKTRKALEVKLDAAIDGWKSGVNDKGVRAAGDLEVKNIIRKTTPVTNKVERKHLAPFNYRKMSVSDDQKQGLAMWFRGCLLGDRGIMDKAFEDYGLTRNRDVAVVTRAALAEGTAGSGAELVPEEWVAEIMKIAEEFAIYRPNARVITVGTDTIHVPRRNAAPTVTWKAEAATAGTGGEPTYAQLDITIKKMLSIYTASTEILEDANVDVLDDVMEQLAEAKAKEEDRVFFEGDVGGLSDPFNGLRFTGSLEELSIGDETAFTDADLLKAIAKLETRELRGAWWYFHPIELVFLMSLKFGPTNDRRPLWLPSIAQGAPPTLYSYPYATTDVILRNRTLVVADKSSLYFGNLKWSIIADRAGMQIDQSIHSKFATDQIDIRLRARMGYGVTFPSALVRIIDFDTSFNAP